jgi:Ser/Thr protein kinase RdoA (MazF antagonist)
MNTILGKNVIKKEKINSGLAGDVYSIETIDNRKFIVKSYEDIKNHCIDDEWNMINKLHKAGINVPKPYEKNANSIIMEQIEGKNLGEMFFKEKIGTNELLYNFTNLLYDLHKLTENDDKDNFFVKEINQIELICAKNGINEFQKYITKIKILFQNITTVSNCIIHRDYHPWNVILKNSGKMYIIDLDCSYGDFRFDVGWTFALMERSGYIDFANTFYKQYEEVSVRKITFFEHFKYLSTLRWLVNVTSSTKQMRILQGKIYDNQINFLENMIEKGIEQIENIIF